MLPTLVIGLREGLEAALIVGIIAAFLRKQGRGDLLRAVFVGVGAAVLLCAAVGVLLDTVSQNLPQRQQEGLETVIGALAVGMVTYMVIWTKRHARGLKGQLEGLAADAMGSGASRAGWAMVAMAFLAVLREGLETAVFLIAAFNETGSGAGAAAGALIGIAASVALGYGIYRGGVRINLSKFFRATGLVLVLVAAGLVVNALHTAHEAGWLQIGQSSTVDLSRLVNPGSVQASLLTGMLGIQSHPVLIEVIGWLLYLVPVGLFVAWPPGRPVPQRRLAMGLAVTTAVLLVGAGVLALVRPTQVERPVMRADQVTARLLAVHGDYADLRFQGRTVTVRRAGTQDIAGLPTVLDDARTPTPVTGRPASLPVGQVARLNGGRLPLGVSPAPDGSVPVQYTGARVFTVALETRTGGISRTPEPGSSLSASKSSPSATYCCTTGATSVGSVKP